MEDKNIKVLRKLPTKKKILTEKEMAMDFAVRVHQKFDKMVKASVLFGSQVKKTAIETSDIDIIIIIDDASINWDMELIAWYREELGKIVSDLNFNKEIHINTIKLTTWWQDLLYGDPVVINILRYGEALIDSGGFYNPIKALLLQGKIHSTPEAVHAALNRAPFHLLRSRMYEMSAIEGIYWAITDSSQAALMMAGKLPPSPEHIPQMLKETFVDTNMLKYSYVKIASEIYELHRAINHRKVQNIKGAEIDKWQEIAEDFLQQMGRLIEVLLRNKG